MKNLTFDILLALLIFSKSNSTDSKDDVIIDPTADSQTPLPEAIFTKERILLLATRLGSS